MKKILTLLLIIYSSIVFAQPKDFYADPANPYGKLIDNLNGIAYNCNMNRFATFIGLDVNFSQIRLSSFLQAEMDLAMTTTSDSKSEYICKFLKKASGQKEYITTKYYYDNRSDILGYYTTVDKTYGIVKRVEITGSKNLIIRLFLKYWCPLQTTVGGYKVGQIAFKEFYSDRITLVGVSSSTAKIVISKGNMTMDYLKTFGIGAKSK